MHSTRSFPGRPETALDTAGRTVREVLLALGRGDDETVSAICRAYASERTRLPGRVVLQLTLRRLPHRR